MSNETKKGEELVDIGIVPYDPNDRGNKYLLIPVNGKTIMVERGTRGRVPPEYAEAYSHRVKMAGRRIKERDRMERELREKQTSEGVSFM